MSINFRTLDLNLLRVFDRVMSEGSLTRAASALAMTQPAASHALKRLHAAFGEPLFVRSAFGMKPTPRAQALWPHVRDALDALREALAPETFDPRRADQVFRIAMADATAAMLVPPLLRSIEAERAHAPLEPATAERAPRRRVGGTAEPAVRVQVQPLATRDPRRLLIEADADLAIGHFPAALAALVAQGTNAPLRHCPLYETRYVCVMRRGHPLARKALTLDAYCAAAQLLVSFSGRSQGLMDQALAALGRRRRIVLTVNQFFTAGRVVTQSDLLTVLPESFVPATGYAEQLVTRELPFALDPISVQMMWPLRLDADPAQRWLRGHLRNAAAAGA